jgi:hypothetical protein
MHQTVGMSMLRYVELYNADELVKDNERVDLYGKIGTDLGSEPWESVRLSLLRSSDLEQEWRRTLRRRGLCFHEHRRPRMER